MASPPSPISDDFGFSKASNSSSAEILLERLVLSIVKSDEEYTACEDKRGRAEEVGGILKTS